MCPKPLVDDSVSYEQRPTSIQTSQSDDQISITIFMCQNGDECHEGLFVDLKMCPLAETCGCGYEARNLRWYDSGSCGITFEWRNPDKCVLHRIALRRMGWWDINWVLKYDHLRSGTDPNLPIYPDGDIRNTIGCRDCGIGGDVESHEPGSELVYETQLMVPGQLYRVSGWFDDQKCGGREVEVTLGYLVYQTTGLSSGEITSIVSSDPPKYAVNHYVRSGGEYGYSLVNKNYFAVDYYPFEVGDPVMLCKINTRFPCVGGGYGCTIDDSDVQQVDGGGDDGDYLIVPYNEVEGR
jgi:hypothetical protein